MTTIQQIVEKAGGLRQSGREGCKWLINTVSLIELESGETIVADAIDISGKYPGTFHSENRGFWWYPSDFKFAE